MRKGVFVGLVILFTSVSALSQERWMRIEKTDLLRGTSYLRFALMGKFLEAPEKLKSFAPTVVIDCDPQKVRDHRGRTGKLLADEISVGTQLETDVFPRAGIFESKVLVQYRQDDGKLKTTFWYHNSDFSALTLDEYALGDFLYSHQAMYRKHRSVVAKKIVVQVSEFVGGELVMQFDLPDPAEVADACGLFWE